MLETTLIGSWDYDSYAACAREALRLFKRVHQGAGYPHKPDGGFQRKSTTDFSTLSKFWKTAFSTSASSWRSGRGRGGGSIYITEDDDAPEDEENQEAQVNAATGEEGEEQLEQVAEDYDFQGLQETLEIVATEPDEAAQLWHQEPEGSSYHCKREAT